MGQCSGLPCPLLILLPEHTLASEDILYDQLQRREGIRPGSQMNTCDILVLVRGRLKLYRSSPHGLAGRATVRENCPGCRAVSGTLD